MRSLVFEGRTWEPYEDLRQHDPRLHTSLCQMLKEMLVAILRLGSVNQSL